MRISLAIAAKVRTLIVVPANLLAQWKREILAKTCLGESDVAVASCRADECSASLGTSLLGPHVVLTSYSFLAARDDQARSAGKRAVDPIHAELVVCAFQMTLVDECRRMSGLTFWAGLQRVDTGVLFGATASLYREGAFEGESLIMELERRFGGITAA
eukprot:6135355-Prymnesium_polylepis.2